MTRCRSALERATIRQSMSPLPVIVCASSTSGMSARCGGDAGVPVPLADLQGDERGHAEAERGGSTPGRSR